MRAREVGRVLLVSAAWVATASATGAGLHVDVDALAWPSWQVRLQLSAANVGPTKTESLVPRSARLLGDYVFAKTRLGGPGAMRLTSGVLVGPREALLDPASQVSVLVANNRSSQLTLARATANTSSFAETGSESVVARPYLGVGYSAGDARTGWGFSADLGLAAQNPSVIRLGRVVGGQSLDDLLRDLRLQPMLQLGVNYAF